METITSRIYKPADFSAGQLHEMLVTLGRKGFSPEMAAEVASTKSGKAEQIVGLFAAVPGIGQMIADHQIFYHKFFGMDVDFSSVRIPEKRVGFDRLIIVAQGLTPNKVYEVCRQNFKCWRYTDDLDKSTAGLHERDPMNGHYAIWVRDRIEADGELKNKSANQIKAEGLTTETLTERLIHELKFFDETGQHLNIDNITLCSGSRGSGGGVPGVSWGGVGHVVGVGWCGPRDAGGFLRARAVVS